MLFPILLLAIFYASPSRADPAHDAAEKIFHALEARASLPESELPADFEHPAIFYVRVDPTDAWTYGVLRVVRIRASVARVISVLDDVPGYVGLFKDLLEAKATPMPGQNDFVVYTETRIPLPLVANDRTSVRYRSRKEGGRRLSSVALVESNHLDGLDGASLLVPLGKGECAYWQLNFVRVGFGAARALPARMFWVENAVGGLQADLALKLRAEQPLLESEEILKRSEELARGREGSAKAAFEAPRTLEQLLAELSASKPKAP